MGAPSAHGKETRPEQRTNHDRPNVVVWEPGDGDRLWVFPQSRDELGSGGDFHIYVDPATHPDATASFARFALGAGGDLAEHRHEKSEEFAYLISGQGAVKRRESGLLVEVPLRGGIGLVHPPGSLALGGRTPGPIPSSWSSRPSPIWRRDCSPSSGGSVRARGMSQPA